jgi:hypothetical protein
MLDRTQEDWMDLRTRLGKLIEFDETIRIYGSMIESIISKFIAAFNGEVDTEFWGHMAAYAYGIWIIYYRRMDHYILRFRL